MQALISVVLPCYNAGNYLVDAMNSLLRQTHKNLEIIAINDGSTDGTGELLNDFAQQDTRVRFIDQQNQGLVGSLNKGIALANGDYIARMDQDDICFPERLEKQMDYLVKNGFDLVGSAISRFYPNKDKTKPKYFPQTHQELSASILCLGPSIAHPTVLAKKAVFMEQAYDSRFEYAEDYALWLNLTLAHKYRMGNHPEILLHYRSHEAQMSSQKRDYQKQLLKNLYLGICQQHLDFEAQKLSAVFDFWNRESVGDLLPGLFYIPAWLDVLIAENILHAGQKTTLIKKALHHCF